MYEAYQADPSSVHESWQKYFNNLENGVEFSNADYNNPTTAKRATTVGVSGLSSKFGRMLESEELRTFVY